MYNKKIEKVFDELHSRKAGLSEAEAEQRFKLYGANKLKEQDKQSMLAKFFLQFKNLMIIILLCAGAISLIVGIIEKTTSEIFEAFVIFAIVIINAVIGLIQENKAEKALESLNKMSEPFCKVLRDGILKKIRTEKIVVGDIVILEAGDIVPADGRLFNTAMLKIEESALTGESLPVNKHNNVIDGEKIALGDRKNSVFSGSIVSYGRGEYIVTDIGMNTELGKIASMLSTKKDETPLDKKLKNVSKVLTIGIGIICVIVFIVMSLTGEGTFINAFMTAIVLAVAAIPEGLPAVVTIVMAMGVTKLSKKNAIIRKLSAVETLGCTQVICSDKTGTLTLNKMTVKQLAILNDRIDERLTPNSNFTPLIRAMVLCNDTVIDRTNAKKIKYFGDPTETALVEYALQHKFDKEEMDKKFVRVDEVPFDSIRKMMSTINKVNGTSEMYTKGGFEEVLNRCTKILDNGNIRQLTKEDKIKLNKISDELSEHALRVLAYAYRPITSEVQTLTDKNQTFCQELTNGQSIEHDLIFLGMSGMIDPPRDEVKVSVANCKQAGIKVVMITGDHKKTAESIARQIGILSIGEKAITGKELDAMTEEAFLKEIDNISVYARVSPENKVRIVKAFKSLGRIVAMTGDGVNDAPSLKAADIGIGMGITGTDVTKGVADMVLADDNFATIETAVSEGRKIYANIQKAISFLISGNITEVLALFFIVLFFPELIFLTPVQLLWVNLITDTFPALAFSNCPADPDSMKKPPRNNSQSLFKGRVGLDIIVAGVFQSMIILACFFISDIWYSNAVAETMALLTLNAMELFHSFNVASGERSVFHFSEFKNKSMIYSFIAGLGLTFCIIYIPGINKIFETTMLSFGQVMMAIGFAFSIILIFEVYKVTMSAIDKNKIKHPKVIIKK